MLLHTPAVKPGLSAKLQYNWNGPHRIVEQLSPVTYKLQHILTGRIAKAQVQRLLRSHQLEQLEDGHDADEDDDKSEVAVGQEVGLPNDDFDVDVEPDARFRC